MARAKLMRHRCPPLRLVPRSPTIVLSPNGKSLKSRSRAQQWMTSL